MKFSVVMDQARFNREVRAFLKAIPAKVREPAIRKIAFDVMSDTVVGLNGVFGNPKRIDTGRLRAAWGVAARARSPDGKARDARGRFLPLSVFPSAPNSTSGDGDADWTRRKDATQLVVSNNVEYAPLVEHGTRHMEPGKHLSTALRRVAKDTRAVRKQIVAGVKDAAQ